MKYTVERRTLPMVLQQRRRILGLPVGPKQDYKKPWVLKRDGKMIGAYETKEEAEEILGLVEKPG